METGQNCARSAAPKKSSNNNKMIDIYSVNPQQDDHSAEIIAEEWRNRLRAAAAKEEKEFQDFLSNVQKRSVAQGMTENTESYKPANYAAMPGMESMKVAHPHSGQVAALANEVAKSTSTGSSRKAATEDWFSDINQEAAPAYKNEVTYEKPFLVKLIEKIYDLDALDYLVIVLVLGFGRIVLIPFFRG